jgi:hypothetical protein
VVGALLDAEAEDGFINNLILSVRSLIPVEALVGEVEKRNKLKMLNPFLEQLVSEGSKVGGRGSAHLLDDRGGRVADSSMGAGSSAGPGWTCVSVYMCACLTVILCPAAQAPAGWLAGCWPPPPSFITT